MSTQVVIPTEQQHDPIIPIMNPLYQTIKLTPIQSYPKVDCPQQGMTPEITFELPGNYCSNLSKSYIQYYVDYYGNNGKTTNVPAGLDNPGDADKWKLVYDTYVLPNSYNITELKVYNSNGVQLLYADHQYELFRQMMIQVARKNIDKYNQDVYFDGCYATKNADTQDYEVKDYKVEKLTDGHHRRLVKIFLGELFNTILSSATDVFFSEKLFITLRFGKADGFYDPENSKCTKYEELMKLEEDAFSNASKTRLSSVKPEVKVSLDNFYFYVKVNKDPACNDNTIKYCLNKTIDFNDFHCYTVSSDNGVGQDFFRYTFTLNSSLGKYLKFIAYRPYDNNDKIQKLDKETTKFRWLINDFQFNPDFVNLKDYDNYHMIKPLLACSWHDQYDYNQEEDKFMEVLNFSNFGLFDLQNRQGKRMDQDIKFTFEIYSKTLANTAIFHRFFIITGRGATVNESGIVNII